MRVGTTLGHLPSVVFGGPPPDILKESKGLRVVTTHKAPDEVVEISVGALVILDAESQQLGPQRRERQQRDGEEPAERVQG